jgi:hypothetical protein
MRPGVILAKIQSSKQFRNPSIYQKLIEQMGIEETGSCTELVSPRPVVKRACGCLGTNYDPAVYDPKRWTDDDHYKALRRLSRGVCRVVCGS